MAKPLSLKSRVIRKGLQVHPNLSNIELADVLNRSEDCKQNDIQVTPNDVANQKQALKQLVHPPAQEAAPVAPAQPAPSEAVVRPKGKPGPKPGARKAPVAVPASNGDLLDDIAAIKNMVAKLGAEQVRRVVDLFG